MSAELQYDVFLSHSARDKAVVRPLAERLRAARVRRNSQPSTFNPQPIRGSDWAQLPTGPQLSTLNAQPISAPLNQERRFLPLRLDGGHVEIAVEIVHELAADGKQLRVVDLTDYIAEKVRTLCASLGKGAVAQATSPASSGSVPLPETKRGGTPLELAAGTAALHPVPDADPFDLLCHLAFHAPVLTRRQRADGVAQASSPASFRTVSVRGTEMSEIAEKDTGGGTPPALAAGTAALHNYLAPEAREILDLLLEKCASDGELQFTLPITVAQASPPASSRTVPVRGIEMRESAHEDTGGGTPPELAAGTAVLHSLPAVLNVPPISQRGNVNEIIGKFGGADQLRDAVQPTPIAAGCGLAE